MLGQLVFPARQRRVARRLVVEALFDRTLQMLRPEAHAERLALQHKAAVHQHFKGIPRRVADREHQRLAREAALRGLNADEPAVLPHKAGQGRVEMHLAAQRFDLFPDGGDDAPEQIGADMRLLLPGDLRRGTMLQKHFGDKAAQRIADAGGQLAVRKRACAALAELDVRVLIELAGGGKMLHRLHPLVQRRAALQHDGPVALPGQQQRREQPRRAKPADDGPVGQRLGAVPDGKIGPAAESNAGRGPCKCRFLTLVLERYRNGIDQSGLAVAGIHRQLCHTEMGGFAAGDAGQVQRFFKGLRLPGGKGEPDVSYQNHTMIAFFFIAAPCIQYGRSGLRFSCSRSCTG